VPEGESALEATPQIFLSFSNHLGSTSAVVDYADGTLVEWKTNYAYGADESEWKNPNPIYDNADEPYGFTGKEEDEEVGLHYFGARYYSSYLGRWLSPDPPVVHGGGLRNYYNYCGNSPYIYVDPDGNDFGISAIVGAIVGAVVGAASAAAAGGDAKTIVISAVAGAIIGAVSGGVGAAVEAAAIGAGATAGAAAISGAAAAAGVTATAGMVQTATTGGSASQVLLSGAVSSAAGMIGGGIGVATSSLGRAGSAIVNYVASVAVSYGTTAISGGLNEDTWDDVLLSASISYWTSYAGSAVGAEVESVQAGGGGEANSTISERGASNFDKSELDSNSQNESAIERLEGASNCLGRALYEAKIIDKDVAIMPAEGHTLGEVFDELGIEVSNSVSNLRDWNNAWQKGDIVLEMKIGTLETPMGTDADGNPTVGFHAQYVKDVSTGDALEILGVPGEVKTLDLVQRPNIGYREGYADTVVSGTNPPATYGDKMQPSSNYPVVPGYAGYAEVVSDGVRYHRLR